ncbi:hypothetical protein [Rhodopirellula sp. SWK7]|uniref:hypothetical protein n=1 Tax=Rhodopirellula sp. SWK7 TaxID=595460 RepID=UPI0011817E84|nr:hypothetical protein [Rhodopirellula sp. SWK7]
MKKTVVSSVCCLALAQTLGCGIEEALSSPETIEQPKTTNVLENATEEEIQKTRDLIAEEEAKMEEFYNAGPYKDAMDRKNALAREEAEAHRAENADIDASSDAITPPDELALPNDSAAPADALALPE